MNGSDSTNKPDHAAMLADAWARAAKVERALRAQAAELSARADCTRRGEMSGDALNRGLAETMRAAEAVARLAQLLESAAHPHQPTAYEPDRI